MDLAARLTDPAPALRKIDELEGQRTTLAKELARATENAGATQILESITEAQVGKLLAGVADGLSEHLPAALKDILGCLVEHVELNAESHQCTIHYRIGLEGRYRLASPTGFEPVSPP